jgi:hypothetical protein
MTSMQSNTAMRIYMALTALVGWFALLLQFPLSIATSRANGMSMAGAIITYFSFFTILTNLLVVLGLTLSLCLPNSSGGRFFSRPVVIAGITAYIAMVGLGYSLLLRHLWAPEGLQKIADVVLHDLVPVLYVAYWLIFVPKSGLQWKNVLLWLTYPLAYLVFVLLRGSLVGRYPYHFVDAGALGYPRVFFNAAMLLCAFIAVGLLLVAIGRYTGRASAADSRSIK